MKQRQPKQSSKQRELTNTNKSILIMAIWVCAAIIVGILLAKVYMKINPDTPDTQTEPPEIVDSSTKPIEIISEITNRPLEEIDGRFSQIAPNIVTPEDEEECLVFLEALNVFSLLHIGVEPNQMPDTIYKQSKISNDVHGIEITSYEEELDPLEKYTIYNTGSESEYSIILTSQSGQTVLYEYKKYNNSDTYELVNMVLGI